MKQSFILILAAVLLQACTPSGRNMAVPPVPEPNPNVATAPSPEAVPTITATLPPSPTPVPPALILADFPLSMGATWKYSAEISYQDPKDYTKLVTWSGSITDRVIDRKTTSDGKIVFTMQEDLKPTPPQDVWRQSRTFDYTLAADGVFEGGGSKIYQWPLSDNLSWKWDSDFGYDEYANFIGKFNTPYGELKGCYSFLIVTHPDVSGEIFCPGIGFVGHSYRHFGTPQVEHFVLVSYSPGQ